MPKFLPESFKGSIFEAQKDICFPCVFIKGHEGDYYLAQENDDGTLTDLGFHFPKKDELAEYLMNQDWKLVNIFGSCQICLNTQLDVPDDEEPLDYLEFVPLIELLDFDSNIPELTRRAFLDKQKEIITQYSETLNNTDSCVEETNAMKNNATILNEFCNQVKILVSQSSIKYMGNLPEFKKAVEKRMAETKALYDDARRDLQILDENQKCFKAIKKDHIKEVSQLKKIISTTNIPLENFEKLDDIISQINKNLELCEQFYLEKATNTRPVITKALRNYKDLENLYRTKTHLVSETQKQLSR